MWLKNIPKRQKRRRGILEDTTKEFRQIGAFVKEI